MRCERRARIKTVGSGLVFILFLTGMTSFSHASEQLVIAASPTARFPIEALGRRFELLHPDIRVTVYYNTALVLRQEIARIENRGGDFSGTGPIHLIAPGDNELITRLQQKYYVLPDTMVSYAVVPLVMVVPESLVDAPASFEALVHSTDLRVAMADPVLTTLGRQTAQVLRSFGVTNLSRERFDVAADAPSVLDHLLHGRADVAIVYGPDAVQARERVRIVAVASDRLSEPTYYSMAMLRSCPNRRLSAGFLQFLRSSDAKEVLAALGFQSPRDHL